MRNEMSWGRWPSIVTVPTYNAYIPGPRGPAALGEV